jgi:hypothetical protein
LILVEDIPEIFRPAELCLETVKKNCVLKYVPEKLRTAKLCLEAVNRDNTALEFVPGKFRTAKLFLEEAVLWDTAPDPDEFKTVESGKAIEPLKNRPFVFEDIVRLDDRSVQRIIREIDFNDLARALRIANEETRARVFKNTSKRAGILLKEEMEYMGPLLFAIEAEEARHRIINTIKQLEETGEIIVR